MRWPLYLTVNVCLIALVGAGVLGVVRRNTRAEDVEQAALAKSLDGLISSWDAAGTPPENRVLNVVVGDGEESSLLEGSDSRSFRARISSWFSGAGREAEGSRRAEEMLGGDRPLADWHSEGLVWAAERQKRLRFLTEYIARAHQGRARLFVVAYDAEARTALSAIEEAGASSADLVLVDKFILLGAGGENYTALMSQDSTDAAGPRHIRETALLWRREGNAAVPAASMLALRDASGRVATQELSGDFAKPEGAGRLVRLLTARGADMAAQLTRLGQLKPRADSKERDAMLAKIREGEDSIRRDEEARESAARLQSAAAERPAAAASVVDTRSAAPAPGYVRRREGGYTVDAPADWKCHPGEFLIGPGYNNAVYHDPPLTDAWAEIFINTVQMNAISVRVVADRCPDVPIRSVQDFRDELDCSVPQSCAPCGAESKCPRAPVGERCGRFSGMVPAAGTSGYFYVENFESEAPSDPSRARRNLAFDKGVRAVEIVVSPPGSQNIYRLEYWATAKEFDRYSPIFEHVAQSLRESSQ